jgi:hypothetical protein
VHASLGSLALGDTAAGTGVTRALRAVRASSVALALEQAVDFSTRRAVRAVLGALALGDTTAATGAFTIRAVRALSGALALEQTVDFSTRRAVHA